jgi:5-methyltetrahydropteroyltriglutamate--homocysteine methyltransferase
MTTKDAILEPADALRRRIKEATKFVEFDLALPLPQCGFASVLSRIRQTLSMEESEHKLARIVEVAHAVWS